MTARSVVIVSGHLALALASAACTDLGDIERGRCGNGVIEPGRGEDCDRDDGSCGPPGTVAECRLLCGPSVTGTSACPAGGACGVDGVCRAPSDQLELTMSGQWTSRHLLIGDADNDLYPELIGVGDNLLDVRLGSGDGTFAQSVSLPNLPLFDVPRAGDVNGDGLTDVLVPVGLGLYSLIGDPLTTLQPILQDSFTMPTEGPMIMTSVRYVAGTGQNQVPATQLLAAMRLGQGPGCPLPGGCDILLLGDAGVGLPAGRRVEHVIGNTLAWAPLSGGTNSDIVAAVAFRDDPGTPLDEGGVFTYLGDAALDTIAFQAQVTGLNGRVSRGAWLSDLDRDYRADLLIHVETVSFGPAVMVAWARATGGFDAPVFLIGGPGPTAVMSPPLTWADLDKDAAADLITTSGVFFASCILRSCSFITGSGQDRSWAGAAVADVDGDTVQDVIAYTQGGAIIDVLLGTGARGFWNEAPLAAPGDVSRIRVGDYDGNGLADVAFATSPFDTSGADEIHVAFGRPDQPPAPPTYMGFVGTVVGMDAAQAPLPGRADTIDDLFVASERESTRGIAIVLGSTSQRMIAPLIPAAGANNFTLVESMVVVSLDGDAFDDVVCLLTEFDAADNNTASSIVRIYTSDEAGTLTERTGMGGVSIDADDFSLRGALWTAIPGEGSGPTSIVGVDQFGRMVVATVSCTGTSCTMAPGTALLTGAEVGEPTSLHTADLDGDGGLDLIATFRAVDGEPGGALVWHRTGTSFSSAQVLSPPAGLVFSDIAAVDLDLDGTMSLLLVARGETGSGAGVLLSERAASGTYGAPVRDARFDDERSGQGVTIHGGDVTGDGLPDVVVVSGSDRSAPRAIAVFTHREAPGRLAASP